VDVSEAARIAGLLRDTMDREPYYGPSVVIALTPVSWNLAAAKLQPDGHSIWDVVGHLTAELEYACQVIEGTAGVSVAGQTTWPPVRKRPSRLGRKLCRVSGKLDAVSQISLNIWMIVS